MKKFQFAFFLSVVFILLSSCSSPKNAQNGEDIKNSIKGTWKIYYETCCGRTSQTTFGGNKTLKFNTKKSTYVYSENESVIQKGHYEIKMDEEIGDMIYMDDNFPAIIRMEEGKLFIDKGYMDLKTEVFQR
ncbi:MAG TPA: hypothetical protein VLZ75_07910 [Chitinophagales bacterium]|nr:hypothetical protein [Chitinophagales bacterium]